MTDAERYLDDPDLSVSHFAGSVRQTVDKGDWWEITFGDGSAACGDGNVGRLGLFTDAERARIEAL